MTLLEAVEKIKKSKKNRESLEIRHKTFENIIFTLTEKNNLYMYWDSYYKMSNDIYIPLDNSWYINNRENNNDFF